MPGHSFWEDVGEQLQARSLSLWHLVLVGEIDDKHRNKSNRKKTE